MANLDIIDRCLVTLLQLDGRLSHTDMARRLGLPEATVRRRIKRLLDEEIVQIVALPEPHRIGYGVHAIVGLRLQPGKITSVLAHLKALRQVRYIAVTAGSYDIVIETFFRNNDELRAFLVDTLGQVEGLLGTETSYVLDIVKRAYRIDLLPGRDERNTGEDDAAILERCWRAVEEFDEGRVGEEAEPE